MGSNTGAVCLVEENKTAVTAQPVTLHCNVECHKNSLPGPGCLPINCLACSAVALIVCTWQNDHNSYLASATFCLHLWPYLAEVQLSEMWVNMQEKKT